MVEQLDYFRCDFADVLTPILEELNGEGQAVILGVEDNVVEVKAPLSLMDKVFSMTARRLKEGGRKSIPPILL